MSYVQPFLPDFPSYVKPACVSDYFSPTFTGDDHHQFCSVIINGIQCGAPRWCHLVFLPVTENECKDTHYHRYCNLTQNQIKKDYPDNYKTTNELCVLCLNRGICCFFIDHPEGEDKLILGGKVAQISLEDQEIGKKRSSLISSYLTMTIFDCLFSNNISHFFSETVEINSSLSFSSQSIKNNNLHDKIEISLLNKDEILKNIDEEQIYKISNFLLTLEKNFDNNKRSKVEEKNKNPKNFYFDNESNIKNLVLDLLQDLCYICKGALRVSIGNNRSDFFTINDTDDTPIFIVEVKKNDPKHSLISISSYYEQIHTYMELTRKKFGNIDIYGALTTLDEWIFFWFEESNEIIRVTTFPIENINSSGTNLASNRSSIFNSNSYRITQENFVMILFSFLLLGLKRRKKTEKIPALSSQELIDQIKKNPEINVIEFIAAEAISFEGLAEFKFENFQPTKFISENSDFSTILYNLKFFRKGGDGETHLMCYQTISNSNQFSLVVIKYMDEKNNEESGDLCKTKIDNEKKGWQCFGIEIVQFETRFYKKYFERIPTLIIPFCFTLNKKKQFDFELSYFNHNKSAPNFSVDHKQLLEEASLGWKRENSAIIAMERALRVLWDSELDHDDLEWRHLGLMPYFEEGGNFILKPVLFDFSRSKILNKKDYNNDFEQFKNYKFTLSLD